MLSDTFKNLVFVCTFLLYLHQLLGQQAEEGNINNAPELVDIGFVDWVSRVEQNSGYRFFYKKEWVASISMDFMLDAGQGLEGLKSHLGNHGLEVYVDNKNIYIFPGSQIVAQLPNYMAQNNGNNPESNDENGLTDIEKNYIQGKMISSIPVLTVGSMAEANGKTCIIIGKIRDESTGEPMVGATVYLKEQQIGAATNVDGEFKLAVAPGKYPIAINHMSMKEQEYYLQVFSSGTLTLEMGTEMIEIGEVTVSANKYDNVKGMQMGYERITSKSMKEIPVVMGEKDVLKVATMLPGVENVGEGSSGFNVRGSAADQNMFYINRIPVYNTSHLFGFFTSFSPDVINDFSLYKSNIPARYGGRLSSIFDISTRQGNKKEFFAQGGISPVTSHVSFEGPVVKDKASFVASWRSSYSDWVLNRIKSLDIQNSSAFFYDATLGINTEIDDKNLLKVFGYNSYDRFSLSNKNDYEYANTGISVIWKHLFPSSVTADFSSVFSRYAFNNTDKNNPSEAFNNKYRIDHFEVKSDFNYITASNHLFEFGGSAAFYDVNRGEIKPYGEASFRQPLSLGQEKGIESAVYISDEFELLPRLNVLLGLRYSFFAALGPGEVNTYFEGNPKDVNNIKTIDDYGKSEIIKFYSGPELRSALNYKTGLNNSVKASYNRMRQYIFMLSNTVAISPNDQWKLVDYHIAPPISDQVTLGFYQDLASNMIESSFEVYRKWAKHIVEYKDGADFISPLPIETQVLQGEQNTYGLEVMVKKKAGKFTGWMSYAYSRSFVQVNALLLEEQINRGNVYPSNYDRPHSFNYVSNLRMNRRLSFSANFVYTTGRPMTYPISVYYSEGQPLLHFSERNKYRIPDYIRMDLSINLEGDLREKKMGHSFWMINVYNLFGRKNAYSIFFEAEEGRIQGYKLSIFAQPIITISWNFKLGNYLSD
jgi:hypothetical protein